MFKAIANFALLWAVLFGCYIQLKRTTWDEKKSILKGLFVTALISVLVVTILIFVVMIF